VPPPDVVIRRFRAEDRGRVAALLTRLSAESLYQRFHSAGVQVDVAVLDSVTEGYVLVAELDGKLIGVASRSEANAELGIVVDDACQRRGIGRALCRELLRSAERAGVRKVAAMIMRSNHAMLRLLQSLDWPLLHVSGGPALEVTIQLNDVRVNTLRA
jgi:L-amino acid N-acyltransferase YncA